MSLAGPRGQMRENRPASEHSRGAVGSSRYKPQEVLVLYKSDDTSEAADVADNIKTFSSGTIRRNQSLPGNKRLATVSLPDGKSVTDAIGEGWDQEDSRILCVEPNWKLQAFVTPNDTSYSRMWALNNTGQTGGTADADIDAPEAWEITTGDPNVIVAVVDTGVDYTHPELADNIWINTAEANGTADVDDDGNGYVDDIYGYDFVDDDGNPMDTSGHGTHVSGTIAAVGNNSLGVAGINWQCQVMACRFLDANGSGYTDDAILAINYAVDNGAQVINCSWGGSGSSTSLEEAITSAYESGVLVVAAAGNDAVDTDTTPQYPSCYDVDNIISVAATNDDDELAYFSNYGEESVDMAAPGVSILSCVPAYTTLYEEDFEDATVGSLTGTDWTSGGTENNWTTAVSDVDANNIILRADTASYPYTSSADSYVVTPEIDTADLDGLFLKFSYRWQIGDNDKLYIDYWDGSEWIEYTYFYGETSSPSDDFEEMLVDIPDSVKNDAMKIRFWWRTSRFSNSSYYGLELDDISVQYVGSDYTDAYESWSGTSMATPHVSGAAALLLADSPGLSVDELKTKLLTGDALDDLDGETVSGVRLNLYSALSLFICAYDLQGDINGDCKVDFEDLALMAANWLVDCNTNPNDPACQ